MCGVCQATIARERRVSQRRQVAFLQHQVERKVELAAEAAQQASQVQLWPGTLLKQRPMQPHSTLGHHSMRRPQDDAARLAALAADTAEFQAHAAAAVAERAGQGRPVGPMELYLRSLSACERKLLPARR